jgi:hypothetical protein
MEVLGKKLATFTIDWLYFAVVFTVLGFISSLVIFNTFGIELTIIYCLLVIFVYYLLMFVLRQMRPRIYVYENGVLVIERGQEQVWAWKDLTHIEGQRHIVRINSFHVWRSGANEFMAGKTAAFRIGALTNSIDSLLDYCFSRIAEKHIPACEEVILKGETLHFEQIDIRRDGLGSGKDFFSWAQIKDIRLERLYGNAVFDIHAKLEGKMLSEHLGSLPSEQAYVFLGLVDRLQGTEYLPKAQIGLINPFQRISQNKEMLIAIGLTILVLAIAFIIALLTKTEMPQIIPPRST